MPPPPPTDVAAGVFPGADELSFPQGRSLAPGQSFWRKLAAFSGPGYLVAVGYMDPGNWATGIAAGSAFGYRLLWVIVLSNLMAMFLQGLAAKLGIVTGLDLAQACRERYRPAARIALWLLCESAIIACDLAEVIGAAIALRLLFHVPVALGVCLTGLEALLVLGLQRRGARRLETIIITLMVMISICFAVELALSHPSIRAIAAGLVPGPAVIGDRGMLFLAVGVLGATVMPHNLYLHSSAVQARPYRRTDAGKREAIRYAVIDTALALTLAVFVNAAILILAAAAFHSRGLTKVVGIEDAYWLLAPALGVGLASTLFALALLASGQNSTITGALAGQIVMEGFTNLRWPLWARRIVSRGLAIVPAVGVVVAYGDGGATTLLIVSQVVLSLQLPFAVYPLVRLTNSKAHMGGFANKPWVKAAAWAVTGAIVMLNAGLVIEVMRSFI